MLRFEELKKDKKLMSGIYVLTLITSLLILALVVRGPEKSGTLITDANGHVTGINRSDMERSERYELSVEASDENGTVEKDVSLTLRASGGDRPTDISDADDRESRIQAGIDTVISQVEYAGTKKISLPQSLPDGTGIVWRSRAQEQSGGTLAVIFVTYLGLLALVIISKSRGDKGRDEERRSIMRGLPRFCNQLFLMMNAGLILSDAFDVITGSYKSCGEDSLSPFERDLAELHDATDCHRISTAFVINEYAVRHDVKEMIRIAAILNENEKRGSDVIESLSRESRYLWDERKIVARESGKMIDTKMTYPLGLLLIVLIVITMAPALLNL